MDQAALLDDLVRGFYPFGIPNWGRMQGLALDRVPVRPPPDALVEGIVAVARLLGRPVRCEDADGYEHALVAGAVHPSQGWLAWVECHCRCKEPHGPVEVEFRLKASVGGKECLDWPPQSYNPYFGCRVGHLAWHGDAVVLVYREKHRTYAGSAGPGGAVHVVETADEWLVGGDLLAYRDQEYGGVRLLSLPGLSPAGHLDAEAARTRGLLPPGYDRAEETRRRVQARLSEKEVKRRQEGAGT